MELGGCRRKEASLCGVVQVVVQATSLSQPLKRSLLGAEQRQHSDKLRMREGPSTGQPPSYWMRTTPIGLGKAFRLQRPLPSFFRMFRILQGGYIYPEEEARFGAIPRETVEVAPKSRSSESKAPGLAPE